MRSGFIPRERNLILTGYAEPNRPRIGRQVAQQISLPFVDVEAQVEERFGTPLDAIRRDYGERRLRTVEAEIMADTLLYRGAVIRVNGSTLQASDHYERLRQTGAVVCLVARLDAVLQRLHLTLGARYHDPRVRAEALGELKREWAIRTRPGLIEVDVTDMSEAEIITHLTRLWQDVALERA